jgi:hypothetical protein
MDGVDINAGEPRITQTCAADRDLGSRRRIAGSFFARNAVASDLPTPDPEAVAIPEVVPSRAVPFHHHHALF